MSDTFNNDELSQAFAELTPDHILDAIEATGIDCDGRFLALNSYENRVYQIGVEDDKPIVAKFYRPHRWSDAAIIEEHQFTLDLAEQEIPVIAPIRNPQGETLHKHGHYRFALYPRRGGRSPELDNPEHLEQLGRFIGRIHALGATKKFEHRTTLDIETLAIKPRKFLLENNFIPDYLLDAYTSVTQDLIEQVERNFEK
ncbi:MAG: serine/threonine protein kinase, partial [Gammaproteobacteria bacterium]|nr:serine/threonine protein kinase [Gammaproteobacteria bacterium]